MGLFIKKPFSMLQAEANESGAKTLKRGWAWSLVALGVGVIIGAGLFSITGTVARIYRSCHNTFLPLQPSDAVLLDYAMPSLPR